MKEKPAPAAATSEMQQSSKAFSLSRGQGGSGLRTSTAALRWPLSRPPRVTCAGSSTPWFLSQYVPAPMLAAFSPKGLDTVGVLWVVAEPVLPSLLGAWLWEAGGVGLQGFGNGSLFSVRRG